METQSPIMKIFMLVGFLVVAGFVVSLLAGVAGALLGLIFKIGIPLAIAYFIVRWLTNASHNRRG